MPSSNTNLLKKYVKPILVAECFTQLLFCGVGAPRAPQLEVSQDLDHQWAYKLGDVLRASCIVRDGRPVANISWYLDDEPLYGDSLTMPTVLDLDKEDLHTIMQNLTRMLQPSDNGKILRCVSMHPAITGNNIASRQLNVTCEYLLIF